MHTLASDGSISPHHAVKLAEAKGLQVLSITDHDTFRGSDLALRASRLYQSPLIIVPGVEVRTNYGDVLVYCEKPYAEFPYILEDLFDWAAERNCIVVAAHPYHYGRHCIGPKALWKYINQFDAIEVWNARGPPLFNYPAMKAAEKMGKPGTSGSDAHVAREIAVAPTILTEEVSSVEEVLEALRKGRVKPKLGLPGPLALAEAAAWAIARRLKNLSK